MSDMEYDVVIVGAGVAGSLMANRLARAGLRVVVLEAGPPLDDRQSHTNTFYRAGAKGVPGSPWPDFDEADSPGMLDLNGDWKDGSKSYLHQRGPLPFSSSWERVEGGAGNHWQGLSIRHVPNDFRLASKYDLKLARDWPVEYDELEEWYCEAEHLIGVSGDHDAWQGVLGAHRSQAFPMPSLGLTYSDQVLANRLKTGPVQGRRLSVLAVPQGRNSVGRNGRPPCMGNNACIPICPIQAKWDPTVTIRESQSAEVPPEFWYRAVACQIGVCDDGKITGIHWKDWSKREHVVRGKHYVVAAHAVESAKLLLMSPWRDSTVANRSGQVGRNLMDHVIQLGWALADEPMHGFRGPQSTATIEAFRDGQHRRKHSAFIMAVSNGGWGWAAGAPYNTIYDMVKNQGLSGTALRDAFSDHMSRQISITAEMEQLPNPDNRVTLSSHYRDKLGIPRPQIDYDLTNYERDAFSFADDTLAQVFASLGENFTSAFPGSAGRFKHHGKAYTLRGAGHVMGTTRMGECPEDSVCNGDLRCHDHDNLFIVGASVFPTSATANPTLTLAALAIRAADRIARDHQKTIPRVFPSSRSNSLC